jgi:hypothetical protein
MKLYHATSMDNLESIREYGLHSRYDGVYFSENSFSALRWIGLGKPNGHYIICEVEVKRRKGLKMGQDHSPFMEWLCPGKVWVSPKPKYTIEQVMVYEKFGQDCYKLVDRLDGFTATNQTDSPFKKRFDEKSWDEVMDKVRAHLAQETTEMNVFDELPF